MSNIKFTSTGSTTVKLIAVGLPQKNIFTANNSSYTLGTEMSLGDGEYIQFSGQGNNLSLNESNYYKFVTTGTGTLVVEGDLKSLIGNSDYVKRYQFFNLFKDCSNITNIASLNFPTTVAEYCYTNMFMNCTGLVNARTSLPATDLSRWCYANMFAGCTALTTPPLIAATKVVDYCFYNMFYNCYGLKDAPAIVARNVTGKFTCNGMFRNCTSLSSVTVSITDWSVAENENKNWLYNVAAQGTFNKPTTLTSIPAGVKPEGWTVVDTYPSIIVANNQTFTFDAMQESPAFETLVYTYNGEETMTFNLDSSLLPSGVYFANGVLTGYGLQMNYNTTSVTSTVPITLSTTALDAVPVTINATINLVDIPTATITIANIPTIEWDFEDEEATTSSVNLLQYIQYTGADSSQLSTIVSELPEGVVYQNGVLSASKENLAENSTTTFNLSASAIDARTNNYDDIQLEIVGVVPDYYKIPFTVQVYNNTTVTLKHNMNIQYSVNNGSWSNYTSNTNISLGAGQFVSFSGNNSATSGLSLNSNGDYDVYGNINSLLNWTDNLTSVVNNTSNAFENMFYRQSHLIHASSLILPAKYANQYNTYRLMFDGCSNLLSIPQIDLLSSIGSYTCQYMFRGCPKITSAYLPLLSATATWACRNMFENCSGLQLINCNFKTWNNCNDWVKNVKSSGKFYKFSELSSAKGVNYIPTGSWSVYNKASLNISNLNIGYSDSGDPVNIDLNNYLTNAGSNTHKFKYISMFEQDALPSYVTFNKNGIITYIPSSVTTNKNLNSYIQIEASNGIKSVVSVPINTLDEVKMTPLTFKAVEGGASIRMNNVGTPSSTPNLYTSVDNGSTWSAYSIGTIINLNENQTVMFSGNNVNLGNYHTGYSGPNNYHKFYLTGKAEAYGNVNSLINYSETLSDEAFPYLFSGCNLTNVQNLLLPSKNIPQYGYWGMFIKCSSFISPPHFDGITYGSYCCRQMFESCTSLTGMCISGTNSSMDCFDNFIWKCSNLSSIDVNITTWNDQNFGSWVQDVAARGTFYKPAALTSIPTGVNGIPSGWNVVNK